MNKNDNAMGVVITVVAATMLLSHSFAATSVPASIADATAAGYVTMDVADAWGDCFTYSTKNDGDSKPYAGRVWSDKEAISANKNYFASTTTVAGAGTGNTPASLTIPSPAGDGGIFVYSGGTHSFRNTTTLNFGTRRVVVRGSNPKFAHYSPNLVLRVAHLEIQTTSSAPFTYELNSANSTAGATRSTTLFVSSLEGESSAYMVMQPAQAEAGSYYEKLVGDASGYLGTIKVTGNGKVSAAGTGHFLALGCSKFGGKVEVLNKGGVSAVSGTNVTMRALSVKSGGVWQPGAQTWTIGDLSIADACTLNVTADTRIVVTNSLSLGVKPLTFDFGGAQLFSFDTSATSTKPAETNVLMTVASGIDIREGDIAVANVATDPSSVPHWRLATFPGENGTTVVAIVHDEVVIGTASDLSPTSASKWSDGLAVHGDAEYYNKWYAFTPNVSGGGEYVFPGVAMTTMGALLPNCEGTVVSNLTLQVRAAGQDNVRLAFYGQNLPAGHDGLQYISGGVVTVLPHYSSPDIYCVFRGYLNRYFRLDSRLEGSGNIRVQAYAETSDPRFRAEFNSINTNYTGKVRVWTPTYAGASGKPATPTLTYSTRFHLWDARNVGGRIGSFAYDGFSVGNMSCVVVTNDVTFDTSFNRGIYIVSMGRFNVSQGATLTFATPVTFAGELRKEGAGVLALGAKPRFIDGDESTDPVAGTNVLNVAAGGIKVVSAEALDGLAVTFAAGAELHVPAVTDDADLAAYGAVMTRTLSSFATDGGKAALVIDDYAIGAEASMFAVATFATKAAADATAARIKPRKLDNGFSGSLSVAATEAGYTIFAKYSQRGMVISYR